MDYENVLGESKFPTYEQLKSGLIRLIEEGKITREDAGMILPELRESEDERMMRVIGLALTDVPEGRFTSLGTTLKGCLAYLKKQKEQKPKMPPKWLYRLEYKDASCGLWYNGKGKWCFESGIGAIDGCKTKTLPMDYDERYKQDGRDWFSSCSRKEDLLHWYSLEDAKKLISKGFVFTRYLATEYHEYDQQTVFIKETSLYREEIDIFELFKQKPAYEQFPPLEGLDAIKAKYYDDGFKNGFDEGVESVKPAERIEDSVKFEEGFKAGRESGLRDGQKYVLNNLASYGLCKPAEWSEEDERLLTKLMTFVDIECFDRECNGQEVIDWLKSLRPKPHWKPNGQQLDCLRHMINVSTVGKIDKQFVQDLYEQLQKLM